MTLHRSNCFWFAFGTFSVLSGLSACSGDAKSSGADNTAISSGGSSDSTGGASTGPGVDTTTSACPTGSERCDCYGNQTCNDGLECRSNLCVAAIGSTGAGGSSSVTLGDGGAFATGGVPTTVVPIHTGGVSPAGGSVAIGGSPHTGGVISTGGKAAGGAPATGGAAPAGGVPSSGGKNATGGSSSSKGGSKALGGTSSGIGGAPTGGIQGNGGTSNATGGSAANSDAATTVSNLMNSCLPDWGNPTDPLRTQVINAIVQACDLFGPPPDLNPGWKMEYCWAHLMGGILKESAYTVDALFEAGSDPTVGLTQIRFSSVVCEFYTKGSVKNLEAMGCAFPSDFAAHASEPCYSSTFWQSTGGDAAHTQWMETPSCNIGLAAWMYYIFATSGGNSSTTVYPYDICSANAAKGADLATGLLSHYQGPSNKWAKITSMATVPSVGTDYVTVIKDIMDCALGTVSGTHPLFIPLVPNITQYCK